MNARRFRLGLLLILLVGAGLRLALFLDLPTWDPFSACPVLDSRVYLDQARAIAAGDVVGDEVFFLGPLYPYVLAPVVGLAPENELAAIRLVQMAFGLLTVLLVAGTVRRVAGPGTALVAAALTAVHPVLLFGEQQVGIAALAVLLNALALRALAGPGARPGLLRVGLAGIPLGLSVLARPNVAPLLLLLPLWFLVLGPTGRRLRFAVARSLVLAVGAMAVVVPVTLRNGIVGGDLVVVSSNGGINLHVCNNPHAWRTGWMGSGELRFHPRDMAEDATRVAEKAEGRALRPSEVSSFWTSRTLADVSEDPAAAFRFLVRKLFLFFDGFEAANIASFEIARHESRVLRWVAVTFGLLVPFLLLGAVRAIRRNPGALPAVLMVLTYLVTLTVFFPLGRYRAPVLPAVILLASMGLVSVARELDARGWRPPVAMPITLVLGIMLAQAGEIARLAGQEDLAGAPRDPVLHDVSRGSFRLQHGDEFGAEARFRRAVERAPEAAFPHVCLADLARWRGDPVTEIRHLSDAATRDPDSSFIHRRLAGLAVGLRDFETAFRALGEAARIEGGVRPDLVANRSLCLRALGRPDEALRLLDAAIAEVPDAPPLRLERLRLLAEHRPGDVGRIRADLESLRRVGVPVPEDVKRRLGGGR